MDSIQNSDSSSSEEIVADLPTTSEEIVAYEHGDESEAIKSRKKLRIKGGKEQALEKNKKNKNACSLCGETDGHNRRTCPKKYAVEDELDQIEVTREEDNLDQSEVTA
ncbi:protein FAR1-RELATED SEQUENCE 5 [Artemisia annua]|uniref:Protein FAR1-RELATED SEQUENCE 5 n=1 Tax=Artemisia annua TaxID=35608 RepID=A0A2U1MD15_ARTAN|nr:protein FAR1-RELATED SEQUENCE 5 [Artemisia annua]